MALPPRLWLPEAGHDLPTVGPGVSPSPGFGTLAGPRPTTSGATPVQRLRRRALWRGEAGLPDRPVLVEWFPLADFEHERAAARRVRGVCHVHLLRLLHIGIADARNAYAVSEAPDGVDLFTVLRAAPGELPPFFCVAVAQKIAHALLTLESHLSRGLRRAGGHGRVNLGTVFIGWDGSVRLLAFAPLGPLGGAGRAEDSVAPELRLSDRLLTSAADVYALGTLLRELLPPAALRRKEFARLIRRCLHPQADQRIALATLLPQLEELLIELRAPIHRAQAIGEVLGRSCPRATSDLIDADWGEHTGDGYPALPPTLAPLSASTVPLSPAWLRAAPPEKAIRRSLAKSILAPIGLGLFAFAALSLWNPLPPTMPNPALGHPIDSPPARFVEPTAPPPEARPGLRIAVAKVERSAERIVVTARLVNPTGQPIAADGAQLRLFLRSAPELPLTPLSPPIITVGAGRVQEVQLYFSAGDSAGPLSRRDVQLSSLPLRDFSSVPK